MTQIMRNGNAQVAKRQRITGMHLSFEDNPISVIVNSGSILLSVLQSIRCGIQLLKDISVAQTMRFSFFFLICGLFCEHVIFFKA